ncbi:MAG: FkbM family methyltransferase [Leptospiraceae bacterium]|nr:FkbM family methyltransferase [Leptospiraceae bacterium]
MEEKRRIKIPDNLFDMIIELKSFHSPRSSVYKSLKSLLINTFSNIMYKEECIPVEFPYFGVLIFPYRKMGAIDTIDFFGIDELIIFSFYWFNRNKYKRVCDAGSNIGLQGIFLDRCGYEVESFEPDVQQYNWQKFLFQQNSVTNVNSHNSALSSKSGTMDFIRVLGNTTSSHIAGSKKNPYGELETFPVKVESFYEYAKNVDLCKMDVEGHERQIIENMPAKLFDTLDIILEVGNQENAEAIFSYIKSVNVNMFSQLKNWNRVESIEDMPFSYKDGSLFITKKDFFPL